MAEPILIAQHGQTQCVLHPDKANRHGLITGATGTGKTITLQTLAEGFSKLGVPVFMADIKGDLTGISQAGSSTPKLAKIQPIAEHFEFSGAPCKVFDVAITMTIKPARAKRHLLTVNNDDVVMTNDDMIASDISANMNVSLRRGLILRF